MSQLAYKVKSEPYLFLVVAYTGYQNQNIFISLDVSFVLYIFIVDFGFDGVKEFVE